MQWFLKYSGVRKIKIRDSISIFMIFKGEKVNTWYRKTWFPRWLQIKKNYVFWKLPIAFGLFVDENNIVKLVIDHAVHKGIAATYDQLLLKQIKIIIIFPPILPLFATHWTNRNQAFLYFWTYFFTGFERDKYHELDSNFYIRKSSNIFKIRLFSTNTDFICDNHIQLTQLFTISALLAQSCTKGFMPV